jgi:DNA-binding NarL/FixJ family response regulator
METFQRLREAQATQLTDPEEKVLRLIFEGYDETEIAQARQSQSDQVEALIAELSLKLGLIQKEGRRRSPQMVQAMVNTCVE